MAITSIPKRLVVHPLMRRRDRMPRLMQLLEKRIRKRKYIVKERRIMG
jgi:hypothetical protein